MDILRSVVIWLIALVFIVIFFPVTLVVWIVALPFDRKRKATHAMLLFQGFFLAHAAPVWKVSVEGRNKAVRGTTYVMICNHQSILDILLVNSLMYRFKWISKIENAKVPFVGWYLKMADYIVVDRGDKESKAMMMEESYKCLMDGTSIMLFPEGTRSTDNNIGFFKRGAFELALATNCPILPIMIDGTGGVLPKHGLIFGGYHRIKIKVFDPVPPGSFGTLNCDELAARFQAMMTEALSRLREEKEL